MSLITKIPVKDALKSRRVPNAFMLYVKEQKKELVKKYPEESKTIIGSFLGKKWRSLGAEEKQVYYDKYNALRKSDLDNSVVNMTTNKSEAAGRSLLDEITSISSVVEESEHKKRKFEEDFGRNEIKNKKLKTEKMSAPSTSNSDLFFKQRVKKKVRHPSNPFMVFAKEKRNSIQRSDAQDKKYHVNTLLGIMWRELPESEKNKYYEKARNLDSDASTSKTKYFAKSKKPGRPRKQKELVAAHIPNLRSMKNHDTASNLESTSKVAENMNSDNIDTRRNNGLTESQVPTDLSNDNYQQTYNNSVRPHFHHLPPPVDPYQSKNCFCSNTLHPLHTDRRSYDSSMRQNPVPDGGMARTCAGAGFALPFFMPYSMPNSHFWMYHQMIQQMYMQNFSQPYCCNFPYSYYRSMYMNSYFPGRNTSGSQSNPMSSTSVDHSTDGPHEDPANDRNSEDELLIVDEDSADHRRMNGTDQEG